MKITRLLFILALFLFGYSGCAQRENPELADMIKDDLIKDATDFMESLRSVLMHEMQTNGIMAAVSVCSDTAQIMTQEYGSDKGIYLRRVSFNNRNPDNAPDEFETKALKHFEELNRQGSLDQSSELFEVIETGGEKSARYIRPIIIQAPCLGCHGEAENINPGVMELISNKYPDDKATGYQVNDLRGAVSVMKKLDN
jgi:hypothetical protein